MALSDEQLRAIAQELDRFERVEPSSQEIERVHRELLGKEGAFRALFRELKDVPAEEKPAIAARLNELRTRAESLVDAARAALAQRARSAQLAKERFDMSLPGLTPGVGRVHPITSTERRIMQLLRPFGFREVYGPEVETEYFCFDALNIQPHHPARDMQDTFFTEELGGVRHVLRTHTTSVQSRALQSGEAPLKVASFGRAYRNETEDASHQAMFHQFEMVWIDRGLTLAHLLGIITHVLKGLYGKRRKLRFVPKYYPYTEPSVGPQIDCALCRGVGCSACGGSGWVTVAGAGMVHRKVLEEFKYDPAEFSGLAFGLGTSRLAAQSFGMPRLKMCYENDLRVLRSLV